MPSHASPLSFTVDDCMARRVRTVEMHPSSRLEEWIGRRVLAVHDGEAAQDEGRYLPSSQNS